MSIRILLADDHKIVRDGLQALIAKEADMEVVAEGATGRDAVAQAASIRPDVAVLDISMPDLNGIEATRQILAHTPGARVIALSMHADRRFVMEMLRAGAVGYLLKDSAFEELARAIRAVAAGQIYLSPGITGVVVQDYLTPAAAGERGAYAALTGREREVLQLLAEGRSTKEAALRLHVSDKTIESHRRQIMIKSKVRSVAELTKYAIREGITSLEAGP
jgi:DNA-binding NarL/FixJ family response regulator